MLAIWWIGLGGFIGAILRHLISGWIQGGSGMFPAGTLAVNFIGSFILGLVVFLAEFKGSFNEELRLFLTIGLCGSFTTMSAFGYESFRLLQQEEIALFTANVLGSVLLTLLALYLGRLLVMQLS